MIIKKLGMILTTAAVLAISWLAPLGTVGAATACDPDPANPLKCFCEAVEADLATASADSKNICQLNEIDNKEGSKEGLLGENGIVKKVFNFLSWLVGLLAAVYVIIGGFKFVTSNGDSEAVASGRKMIIFALVGLVVVISSNLIINFVIGLVNNASK